MNNLDSILKPTTQTQILNNIVKLDNLDVYLINSFKKDAKCYKHKQTNELISVEEFYIRFRRDEDSFTLYANGETADSYEKVYI